MEDALFGEPSGEITVCVLNKTLHYESFRVHQTSPELFRKRTARKKTWSKPPHGTQLQRPTARQAMQGRIQTAVCCASFRLHGVELLLLGLSQVVELLDALVRLLLHLILHNRDTTTANSNRRMAWPQFSRAQCPCACLLPASAAAGADEKRQIAKLNGARGARARRQE
jgi:hypothetical protein